MKSTRPVTVDPALPYSWNANDYTVQNMEICQINMLARESIGEEPSEYVVYADEFSLPHPKFAPLYLRRRRLDYYPGIDLTLPAGTEMFSDYSDRIDIDRWQKLVEKHITPTGKGFVQFFQTQPEEKVLAFCADLFDVERLDGCRVVRFTHAVSQYAIYRIDGYILPEGETTHESYGNGSDFAL